jgi:hypothetical protein
MSEIYIDQFSCWENVVNEFSGRTWEYRREEPISEELAAHYVEPDEVLIAKYTYEDYSGSATVVYRRGRKWYLIQAGHCSCYGLEEGGMDPEEFANAALFKAYLEKTNYLYGLDDDELNRVRKRFKLKPVVRNDD